MALKANNVVRLLINARDNTSAVIGRVNRGLFNLKSAAAAAGAALLAAFSIRSVTQFFRGAIDSAADFEQAMARVQAATQATPEDMALLAQAAEDMGQRTKFTSSDAAEALEVLGRTGLKAADSVTALPTVLSLATAEGLSLAESAGIVTKTVAQFGLAIEEAERVADVLVATSQSANTNVQQLGQALKFVGAVADGAGLSLERTAGFIGTLANSGIQAEQAGTSLRSILASLGNTGGAVDRELAALGITSRDLGDVIDGIAAAGTRGERALQAFEQSAQPSIRTLATYATTARNLGLSLEDVQGATARAAEVTGNTFQGAVARLNSAWDSLRRSLVQPLLEPLAREFDALATGISNFTANGVERFQKAALQAFETAARAVREFIASVDPQDLLDRFGRIVQGVTNAASSIVGSFTAISRVVNGAIAAIQIAFNNLKTVVGGIAVTLTAPLALLGKAIQATVNQLARFRLISEETSLKVDNLAQVLVDLNASAVQVTQDGLRNGNAALDKFGRAITGAQKPAEALAPALEDIGGAAAEMVDPIKEARDKLNELMLAGADSDQLEAAIAKLNLELLKAAGAALDAEEAYAKAAQKLDELVAAGAGIDEIAAAKATLTQRQDELTVALDRTTEAHLAEARANREAADASKAYQEAIENTRQSAERLGLDWDVITNRLSEGTQQNVTDLKLLAQSADVTGQQLRQAFDTAVNAAKSKADIEALREAWQQLGREGKISADELKEGLEQLDSALKETSDGAETLTDRLNKAADALQEKRKASEAAAKSARENAAAQREEASATQKAGDAAESSAKRGSSAASAIVSSLGAAWRALTPALSAALSGVQRVGSELLKKANDAEQAKKNLQGLAKALRFSDRAWGRLYGSLMESARAYRALAAAQQEAQSTSAQLEIQLAQLRGEHERAAELANRQALAELQAQLLEAEIEGDQDRIADLQRAIQLTKQIGEEQIKQAQESERERQAQKKADEDRLKKERKITRETQDRPTDPSPSAAPSAPTRDLGKLTIDIGGRDVEVFADDATAQLLERLIREQRTVQ